ncbi:hypothetical protein FOCC_FOCC012643 [Frankliniella occidentalis]|nr:hypothetical protein FOCC_FOCC012643 [Frankliniella occidentalis]
MVSLSVLRRECKAHEPDKMHLMRLEKREQRKKEKEKEKDKKKRTPDSFPAVYAAKKSTSSSSSSEDESALASSTPEAKTKNPLHTPGLLPCWRCGRTGHLGANCTNSIRCTVCGMPDVLATSCPNCRRAAELGNWSVASGNLAGAWMGPSQSSFQRPAPYWTQFPPPATFRNPAPHLDPRFAQAYPGGLLDSGSNRTLVGRKGMKILLSAGLSAHAPKRFQYIKVANKGIAPIESEVSVPFEVAGKTKIVDVLFVPQLSSDMILGLDFWRRYNLRPDFVSNTCEVNVDGAEVFSASTEEEEPEDNVLTPDQRAELEEILADFRPVLDTERLGCLRGVEHHIDTGDAPPCKQKYNSLNPKLLAEAHKGLDERLANGTVEPSESPYSSPLLLLRKKDQGWRWVVDFRELNKNIERPSAHPLPHINPMLWNVRGGTIFSSIDVKDAYLQIPLDKESRAKTAFAVPGAS